MGVLFVDGNHDDAMERIFERDRNKYFKNTGNI
jgi:metallophosphoesterase superfamily enzyme